MVEPDETEALRARVAKLEDGLRETQAILARCAVATVAASFVVQNLGREHATLVEHAGLSPNITPLLVQLDKQLKILISSIEEAGRGG